MATTHTTERAPCPYCGHVQRMGAECVACRGLFEPLSRRATQDAMGPWQVRDEANPFLPGCSYQTLRMLIARGRVGTEHIIRGPTTRQFWVFARDTPGVAHLLGECHSCHAPASHTDRVCKVCRASFAAPADRAALGIEMTAVDRNGAHPPTRYAHAAVAAPTGAPLATLPFERITTTGGGPGAARLRRTNLLALVCVVAVCAAVGAWFWRDAFDADRSQRAGAASDAPTMLNEQSAPSPSAAASRGPDTSSAGVDSDPLVAEIHRIVEGVDEADLDAVRTALQTLQGLRSRDGAPASLALLNAEIERLERRIDELILRKFL